MAKIFNLIGTLVETTAITAGVILATVAGIAYVTKPDDKMLKKDIETQIISESSNPVEHLTNKIISKVATGTSTTNVKDFIVLKTADVTFADGTKQNYIGAFQHWLPVNF